MKVNKQNYLKGLIVLLFIVSIVISICFIARGSGVNTKVALKSISSEASSSEDKLVTETVHIEPIVGAPPPEYKQEIIVEDKELITRVVFAEAGNQPYVGKLLVAATIRNRSDQWGMSTTDVVTATGQYAKPYNSSTFTKAQQKQYDDCKQAVEEVFNNYSTYDDVIYFVNPKTCNPKALKWFKTKQYVVTVADHTFYKEGQAGG